MQCDFAERPLDDGSKPWAEVVVSALIINLATLIGVVVLAGEYLRKLLCPSMEAPEGSVIQWKFNIIPMFAAGALLATSFFLIFPVSCRRTPILFIISYACFLLSHTHRRILFICFHATDRKRST